MAFFTIQISGKTAISETFSDLGHNEERWMVMKTNTILIILASAVLHILPIACIILIAVCPIGSPSTQIALAAVGLVASAFGLGYYHGHHKTLQNRDKPHKCKHIPTGRWSDKGVGIEGRCKCGDTTCLPC